MPATKLTTPINVISTKKPVRLSERCGVTRAENSVGWSSAGSKSLPAVIAYQYIPIMAKISKAKTLDTSRGPRGVQPVSQSQSGAEGRARASQPLYAAGRRGAVGAGNGRRRQQGNARAVCGRR